MRRRRKVSGSQLVIIIFSLLVVLSMVLGYIASFRSPDDFIPTPTSAPAKSEALYPV